jgi:hypothetical protein
VIGEPVVYLGVLVGSVIIPNAGNDPPAETFRSTLLADGGGIMV